MMLLPCGAASTGAVRYKAIITGFRDRQFKLTVVVCSYRHHIATGIFATFYYYTTDRITRT